MSTATITSILRRLAPTAALALSGMAGPGCANSGVAYSPAAVAAYSPPPQAVGSLEAYPLAQRYVAEHPGTDFMVGCGESMRPLYNDHTVIITEQEPLSGLRPGMTVVFLGESGFPVAHVLVKKTPDGWISMGIGNPRCDELPVRDDNYMAVVVRAYEPASSPMLALIAGSTDRAKGAVASNP